MSSPKRLSVKIFASPDPGSDVKLEPFTAIYHRFN